MINEENLLKGFAKALDAENVLSAMEEKKIKEKKLLESMDRALYRISNPPPVETPTLSVIEELEQSSEAPDVSNEVVLITEIGRQPEPELPKNNIINATVKALSAAPQDKIQQVADRIPDSYRKELDIIKKSIADFHRFAQRHSQLGGGGAGSVDELTFHTTSTSSDYQITRKDYYVGVNHSVPITITLPGQNLKSGRQVVVKDESGHCSVNNITIVTHNGDMIDNSSAAVLAIDNGSLTFIYSNGWRII